MDFNEFQRAARRTSHLQSGGPQGAITPMLGLAGGTGAVLGVYQRYLRDNIDSMSNRELLSEGLGDLLWYVAAVASACDLSLEEIAALNLSRARSRHQQDTEGLPVFDAAFPAHERFPRRMVIEFREDPADGNPRVHQTIVELTLASDDPPPASGGERLGFGAGRALGDAMTDNSRSADGYRYHDAIHLGFMAVLNWSPTTRALLKAKRKSDAVADEVEDGARAIFAEEGIAAVLARLAQRRTGFMSEASVDGDVLHIAAAATTGLEVEVVPAWLWRRAISQGFRALRLLRENAGGYLIADLDKRTLTYRKVLG